MFEFLIPLSIFTKIGLWFIGGLGTLIIAEDVVHYFLSKYPDSKAADRPGRRLARTKLSSPLAQHSDKKECCTVDTAWIDRAIDKLVEVCGISKETATRVILSTLNKKGLDSKR